MATQHPCSTLPLATLDDLPVSVDVFLEKAMGGTPDLLLAGCYNDPALFRVEVDLRDLALLAGPKWRALFAKVTNAKAQRVQAGHANV